ncbi:hypothetical protein LBMAG56_03370 [Verrucomicrobiota bacterium]|nr:hypothetical protein LBMAG56_03370 [Verrucomicrobiota bacterium]
MFTEGAQGGDGVALGVEADEEEIHLAAEIRRERGFEALEVVDDDGTGEFAVGEEKREDLGASLKDAELDLFVVVGGPAGVELVEGFVGERRARGQGAATRRKRCLGGRSSKGKAPSTKEEGEETALGCG